VSAAPESTSKLAVPAIFAAFQSSLRANNGLNPEKAENSPEIADAVSI